MYNIYGTDVHKYVLLYYVKPKDVYSHLYNLEMCIIAACRILLYDNAH